MNENNFFHEFDGEEIQKGSYAFGKYDVIYEYESGKVQSIRVSQMFQSTPGYLEVDLDLPYRQNGIYQICTNHLKEKL